MKTTITRIEKELERLEKQSSKLKAKYEKLEMYDLPCGNEYRAWFKMTEAKVVLKKTIKSLEKFI